MTKIKRSSLEAQEKIISHYKNMHTTTDAEWNKLLEEAETLDDKHREQLITMLEGDLENEINDYSDDPDGDKYAFAKEVTCSCCIDAAHYIEEIKNLPKD